MTDNQVRHDIQAILDARQSAAHAQQDAQECRRRVQQMEHVLTENTAAYNKALYNCRVAVDDLKRYERGNRVTAIMVLVAAVVLLVTAILQYVS